MTEILNVSCYQTYKLDYFCQWNSHKTRDTRLNLLWNNLPQAVCSAFATLLLPPQLTSHRETESPGDVLIFSPGQRRHVSSSPEQ